MRLGMIHSAVQKARENPEFAVDLIRNPETYQVQFSLQPLHIAELKAIERGDVDKIYRDYPPMIKANMLALVIAAVFRFVEERQAVRDLLSFEEIVRIARACPRVASALVNDTEKYRGLFYLSNEEIKTLKTLFAQD